MADKFVAPTSTQQDDFAARIADSVAKAVADATVKIQERIAPIEARSKGGVSVFNPDGRKVRPRLTHRVIFAGAELKEKFLTNEEIDVLNTISDPGIYHNGAWKVTVRIDESGNKTVFFALPVKDINQRMELPRSLMEIVAEINKERAAQKAVAQ